MAKGNQTITIDLEVRAKLDQAKAAIDSFGKATQKSLSMTGKGGTFNKEVQGIQKEFADLQALASKPIKTSLDAQNLINGVEHLQKKINALQANGISADMIDNKFESRISSLNDAFKEFKQAKDQAAKDSKLENSIKSDMEILKKFQTQIKSITAPGQDKLFINLFDKSEQAKVQQTVNTYKELVKLESQASNKVNIGKGAEVITSGTYAGQTYESLLAKDSEFRNALVTTENELHNLDNTKLSNLQNELKNVTSAASKDKTNAFQKVKSDAAELVKEIQKVAEVSNNSELKNFANNFNFDKLKYANANGLEKIIQDIQKMGNLAGIETTNSQVNDLKQSLNKMSAEGTSALSQLSSTAGTAWSTMKDSEAAAKSIQTLTSRIQYFFSLQSGFRLMTRAIREAYQTVSSLDKAMTETAVVTENTVGDMWNKLDEYTARAKKLGATTQGAYETATLYYQQGLNDQQAAELSTETMKMARIAGMDYSKTTDAMTAALRGFNMELNAASAQNVNDVYSELAAKTASDTQELSTAMEKTASLAHNAGMDLETTAVYLAQALETTREAPENIGTAMKTILARFQSLTKDPDTLSSEAQELLEGETVDANNVEAALRKAGVALRDEAGEFRDAKDVMLELNAVWDTLDKNTQRYIATQTAGSRQQSRFIAMMQDYSRTTELLGYAQNSAGASQKQFDKTLESLEAKVNKLSDAWNEFLMGITNNTIIKGAVDIITGLINVVNKLTGSLGPLFSMVTKTALSFGLFKAGGVITNNLIKAISGNFDKTVLDLSGISFKGAAILAGRICGSISTAFKNIGSKTAKQIATEWIGNIAASFNSGKLSKQLNTDQLTALGQEGVDLLASKKITTSAGADAYIGSKIESEATAAAAAEKKLNELLAQKVSETEAIEVSEKVRAATLAELNVEQTALNAAEQADVVTRAIQIGQLDKENAAWLTQMAAKEELTTEEIANITTRLVDIGLIKAERAEILKEVIAEEGLIAALKKEIATRSLLKLIKANPIGAAIAAVTATVLAGVGIWKLYQKSVEKACERAQNSIKDYEDTVSSVQENLNTINDNKATFTELSAGVNDLGENVGLTASQFSEYHEIVNKLVAISPTIIKGYDSEGNAIIDKTTALRDLIKVEQEELNSAKRKYTSSSNIKDIITDVNTKNQDTLKNYDISSVYKKGASLYDDANRNNAKDILDKQKTYAEDRLALEKEILDLQEKESAISADGKENILKKNSYSSQIKQKQQELTELDNLNSAANEIKTNYSEITNVLMTYASTLDTLKYAQNNFSSLVSAGIQNIAMSGKTADEMRQSVQDLGKAFADSKNLKSLKAYKKAQDTVTKAKEKFDESAQDDQAIKEYNDTVNESYEDMIEMAEKYEASTDASMQAVGQAMRAAATAMKNYASESKKSLTEALNPLKTYIDSAQTYLDSLNDTISEYTATDKISEALDTALETKNIQGKRGSELFRQTAKAVMDEQYYANKAMAGDYDAIYAKAKEIQSYTAEGSEAAKKFYNKLKSMATNKDFKDIIELTEDGKINIKDEEGLAKKLGMSMTTFSAAVQKLSQYTAVQWGDIAQVISALGRDENIYKGNRKAGSGKTDKNDKKSSQIIVTSDYLLEQTEAAGVDYAPIKEALIEQGHIILDASDDAAETISSQLIKSGEFSTKNNKNLLNGDKMIAGLANMYSQDELKEILERAYKEQLEQGKVSKSLSKYFDANGELNEDKFNDEYLDAVNANQTYTEEVSNVISSEVVSRMDMMLALMGSNNKLESAQVNIDQVNNNKDKDLTLDEAKAIDETAQTNFTELDTIKKERQAAGTWDKDSELGQQWKEAKKAKETSALMVKWADFAEQTGMSSSQDAKYAYKHDADVKKRLEKGEELGTILRDELPNFSKISEDGQEELLKYYNTYEDIIEASEELNKTETDRQKVSKLASEAAAGQNEEALKTFKEIRETADGASMVDLYNSLPDTVKTKVVTEFPQYKVLDEYSEEINNLEDKEVQTEIKTAISEGNFDITKEPWKSIMAGNDTETKKLALDITASGNLTDILDNGKGSIDVNGNLNIDDKKAQKKISNVQKAIKDIPEEKPLDINVKWNNKAGVITVGSESITVKVKKSKAFGGNLAGSMAFGSAAKAKRGKLGPSGKGGQTLTGELGPELVWEPDKSISYLVGENGPEMRNLPGNAVVWPADQTKRIMASAAKGKNFGSAGTEVGDFNDSTLGTKYKTKGNAGGKQTGKNGKKPRWYDTIFKKWYNAEKEYEKYLKRANLNQKLYKKMLEDPSKSPKESYDQLQKLMTSYREAIQKATAVLVEAKKSIKDFNASKLTDSDGYYINSKGERVKNKKNAANNTKYVKIKKDDETGRYYTELTEAGKKAKANGGKVAEAVKDAEASAKESADKANEALDNIDDAQDELIAQQKENRDNAISFIGTVIDMVNAEQQEAIDAKQDQIDALNDINDSINDANQRLISSIRNSINKLRQDRQNEKTEKSLAEKRAQLELLKRDNSGKSNNKIRELEKEIAEAEQDYADSLVDQQIDALEADLDVASEQRERQIAILEKQLDIAEKSLDEQSGKDFNEALSWISSNFKDGQVTEEGLRQLKQYLINKNNNNMGQAYMDYYDLISKIPGFISFMKDGSEYGVGSLLDFMGDETEILNTYKQNLKDIVSKLGFSDEKLAEIYKAIDEMSIEDMMDLPKFWQTLGTKIGLTNEEIQSLTGATSGISDQVKSAIESAQILKQILQKAGYGKANGEYYDTGTGNYVNPTVTTGGGEKVIIGGGSYTPSINENGEQVIDTRNPSGAARTLADAVADTKDTDYKVGKKVKYKNSDGSISTGLINANGTITDIKTNKSYKTSDVYVVDNYESDNGTTTLFFSIPSRDNEEIYKGTKPANSTTITFDDEGETDTIDLSLVSLKSENEYNNSHNLDSDAADDEIGLADDTDPEAINGKLSNLPRIKMSKVGTGSQKKTAAQGLNKLIKAGVITNPKGKKYNANAKAGSAERKLLAADTKWSSVDKKAMKKLQNKVKVTGSALSGWWNATTYDKFHSSPYFGQYKTGGLADYTGPAWLDGTPTKPELVLNAKDTENFIQLKDTLRGMDSISNSSNIANETSNINIQIDVAQMANDYDAEQLAKQIEKAITKSSKYKNVNTVRRSK